MDIPFIARPAAAESPGPRTEMLTPIPEKSNSLVANLNQMTARDE
jgi:hypothetical protein